MSDNLENVKNLHNRLKEIFDEHKYKERLLKQLQGQMGNIGKTHEEQMLKQGNELKSRIIICQQQSRQQMSRIKKFEELVVLLKREKKEAVEKAVLERQKCKDLNEILDSAHKEVEKVGAELKACIKEKCKIESDHARVAKEIEKMKKRVLNLDSSRDGLQGDLKEAYELEKSLNNLLSDKDIENASLIKRIKKLEEDQRSLEKKLKNQFQEELDRYVSIHNGVLEKEKKDLMKALKEKTEKSLTEYKEAIMMKNHEIENLSNNNAHLKKIVESLKKDVDLAERQEKRWEQKAKSITLDKDTFQINVEKKLKNKEILMKNLHEKYANKISEFSILEKKQKHLRAELNVYYKFISNEEKIFEHSKRRSSGSLSSFSKRRCLNPPKLEGIHENILELECSNLNKSEFYLNSLVEDFTSLSGWSLVINDQIETLELQDVGMNGKEKILVTMDIKEVQETSKGIFWKVDLSRVNKNDSINLVDPSGITQSRIEFKENSWKKSSDFCVIM